MLSYTRQCESHSSFGESVKLGHLQLVPASGWGSGGALHVRMSELGHGHATVLSLSDLSGVLRLPLQVSGPSWISSVRC